MSTEADLHIIVVPSPNWLQMNGKLFVYKFHVEVGERIAQEALQRYNATEKAR